MRRISAHLPPRSARTRIGLFGGSFDPPHSGHVHVAQTALTRLGLDQLWWFPTPGNPLKELPSAYADRIAAVAELTAHQKAFRISTVEQARGLRYTTDLVALLRRRAPHAQFVWVMGGDSLMTFHYWKDWQDIAQTVPLAIIARPGFERAALASPFARLFAKHRLPSRAAHGLVGCKPPAWTYIPAPLNPISSTALRRHLPG